MQLNQLETSPKPNGMIAAKAPRKPRAKKQPSIVNNSGIFPFEYKVLVLPDEFQRMHRFRGSDGKMHELAMPDETVDTEQRAVIKGRIIDVSPVAFTYETWPKKTRIPKVGDRVMYGRYAGSLDLDGNDGKKYRLINDKDIIALLSDDADPRAARVSPRQAKEV